ncbi:hypothetical protein A2U01_0014328, partial [Trifolium medium]|nr:hypothetical protein [Trifolium medium]
TETSPADRTLARPDPSGEKENSDNHNALHTGLSKLQPTKATGSVETAGNHWHKQKVYICDLVAYRPEKTWKEGSIGKGFD